MRKMKMACLLLVALLTLLCSCSRNQEESAPYVGQEQPEMVMENAVYTLGRQSEDPLVIEAKSIEVDKQVTKAIEVRFSRGSNLTGSCDSAVLYSSSSKTALEGNVTVELEKEGLHITAQELIWDRDTAVFSCDGEVTVSYEDGTTIHAMGFKAQPDEDLYEFSRILEGWLNE